MTDLSANKSSKVGKNPGQRQARILRRYAADRRLRYFGLGAVAIALGFLALLVVSISYSGYQAFTQTHVVLDVTIDPEKVDAADPFKGNYRVIIRDAVRAVFPDVTDRRQLRDLVGMVSSGAQYMVRGRVMADLQLIGTTFSISVPVADPVDQFRKGNILRDTPESRRRMSDQEIEWYDQWVASGAIESRFNWALIFSSDSRYPELAGLKGAIAGSFYALLVCIAISFPVGIAAAVYLEEFSPKNRWTTLVEVNINNLAAVPSIVFGLLGLAVFLGWFGLPRSVPLVGGMTLALMTLPTIVIVTRAAITAVPPSIREAALGIGASRHQVVMHHVLPLSLPGIMTGTIIAMAQALGETAPLLLIGMNAFIAGETGGVMDPSTALPTQIFIWADSPERGFVARTSAAIMVLLAFLIVMNGIAIYLRQKFERKW
jgi:phosphate transport system permease protein